MLAKNCYIRSKRHCIEATLLGLVQKQIINEVPFGGGTDRRIKSALSDLSSLNSLSLFVYCVANRCLVLAC